ncbi:hypothetical protein AGMMS49940_18470 [Spirochaetia bacterium]|nr:hypothetical protein AGMMS49940_18470 [Spirochaetia bacterium]
MKIVKEESCFEIFSMDITNHCNARCKFCFNTWGQSYNMKKETFKNIVAKVFPVTKDMPDNGRCAYISCLYEPQ